MSMFIFKGLRSFAPLYPCGWAVMLAGVIGSAVDKPPPPLSNQPARPVIARSPVGTCVSERISLSSAEIICVEIPSSASIGNEVLKLKKLAGCDILMDCVACACDARHRRCWMNPGQPGLPPEIVPRLAVAAAAPEENVTVG